jgi:RHS repeat-associated protein
LTNITHKNNRNKIIDAFSYTHDNVGNRLTKTEDGIVPHAPDKKINYTYDAIYRLQAAEPEKRGKGKLSEAINKYQTENYTYDAVGNRQRGPHSKDSYSYNAGNELITSTGRIIFERDNQYEYDLNGNLIKKTQTIKNKWKLITTYAYDDENRLIEVKIQKGHKIKEISFTYDPLGRRISKTVGRADFEDEDEDEPAEDENDKGKGKHGRPFQPRTTYYVYDDQNIIAEYDENNRLIASYVHGPNIDEPLSAEIRRDWVYYHADGLGSITTLTSHMGNVLQKYDYDSFGNMRPAPRWIKQPFTYTGREFDQETGLYYYRARYYDAKVGRFITKDPIGFDGGDVNLYVYVGNNPINWIDPFGLFTYWESRPGATGKLAGEALAAANCMEKCMGKSFIVSGGSEKTGHAKNSKHYTNQAFDMYHGGHDRKKTFCCALKCNIKYIKDESATANHWHFQTVPRLNGSRGALPTTEECCER